MSRVPIPCPANGCTEIFIRHTYLSSHFQTTHSLLIDLKLPSGSHLLKPTRLVFAPVLTKLPPPPLPTQAIPIYMHPPLPVQPSSRLWTNHPTRKLSKSASDDMKFEDLPPVDHEDELLEEVIIRPRVSEALPQLAAPQSAIAIPPRNEAPPKTIGYDVFGLNLDDTKSKRVLPDGECGGSSQDRKRDGDICQSF